MMISLALGACSRPVRVRVVHPTYDEEHPKPQSSMDADQVRANLSALRVRQGRSPVMPFPVADGYLVDAKRRIAKGRDPMRALDDSLQSAADEGDRDIRCWSLVAHDLDALRFPPPLITMPDLHAAIAVIHREVPDGLGRHEYIVLVAISVDYLKQSGPAGREADE